MIKPRMLVLSTFAAYPAVFGGQVRLWSIYSRLSRFFDVTILAYDPHLTIRDERHFTPDLRVISLPLALDDRNLLLGAMDETGLLTHDVQCAYRYALSDAFRAELYARAPASDYLVCAHPYFAPRLANLPLPRPKAMVYDAVDCEIIAKQNYLKLDHPTCSALKRETIGAETLAYNGSDLVVACSFDDLALLTSRYGPPPGLSAVVRNGTDASTVRFYDVAQRRQNRAALGLAEIPTFCFLGSGYYANVESLRRIVPALQRTRTPMNLILIGDCASHAPESASINLRILRVGRVSAGMKSLLLGSAHMALHLIFSGSGTTLKLIDYMASGLPVVGTALGFRGVPEAEDAFLEVPDEHALLGVLTQAMRDPSSLEARGHRMRAVAEQHFDWGIIATAYADKLRGHNPGNQRLT